MRLTLLFLLLSAVCFSQSKRVPLTVVSGDMSANIKKVISDPVVEVVELERSGSGDIKVTGWIDFKGKVLRVSAGTKITGFPTLANVVIEAGYNQQIFSSNTILVNASVTGSRVSVKWFGATGNGSTDDYATIMKAGETVIKNTSLPRTLYIPPGSYTYSQPLLFSNAGKFFSLNLIGEEGTHFTSAEYSTRLIYTGRDGFAIGYQRARSSLIKGLSIQGPFVPAHRTIAEQFATPYATYAAGVADNRYAPLQGIAIDPNPPASSETTGGSSAVNITECRIFGFTVGVGYSLNGQTYNAENCTIEKVSFENCKAAIAFGQAQIKNNYVRQIISWGGVHTMIDANTYGSLSGLRPTPAFIDGMNLAGGVNRIFNVNSNFTFAAQNIYAELLFEIGRIESPAPWSIKYSTFHFPDEASVPFFPEYHLNGTNGDFETCDFRVYDDKFNKRMILRGDQLAFTNCRFDRPPLEQLPLKEKHRVEYKNCYTGSGFDFGWSNNNTATGTYSFASLRTRGKTVYDMGASTQFMPLYSSMVVEFESTKMDDIIIPSNNHVAINKIGNELHLKLPPTEAARLRVNDYISEYENVNTVFNYESTVRDAFPVYGRIKSIETTGEIILVDVPKHISSVDRAFIYASREHRNSIEDGTVTITNNVNTPLAGDAVDAYPLIIQKGTIWKHLDQKYICTKSGYLNAAAQGKPASMQSQWMLTHQ